MSVKTEAGLLKALTALEDLAKGGDALENADTEGGLTSEGKKLGSKISKAASASDMSEEDDSEEDEAESESEDESESPPAAPTKKPPMQKSLRDFGGDELSKGMRVNQFLEEFVGASEAALDSLAKSLGSKHTKQQEAFERFVELDTRFKATVAKTLMSVHKSMASLEERIGQTAAKPKPKSKLSKSEVVERPGVSGDADEADDNMSPKDIMDYMLDKVASGKLEKSVANDWSQRVMAFEANGYDLTYIPKAVLADLRKA